MGDGPPLVGHSVDAGEGQEWPKVCQWPEVGQWPEVDQWPEVGEGRERLLNVPHHWLLRDHSSISSAR